MSYNKTERHEDFQWFKEKYSNIYKEYGECYVGIRNKEILGVYKEFNEGLDNLKYKYGLGNFSIQYCNGNESGYTVYISSPIMIV